MLLFLYSLIIFPIVQVLDLCYSIIYRIFKDPGIALSGVSVAVSVFTLPLYFIAEKYQEKEKKLQKQLKPKIHKIKTVFSGDEQYMILSTYYKQNNYHPIYAMRSMISLFIQIPFFIAAYSYLSHLELLQGASFLFLKDLMSPDNILSFHNNNINILPFLMTLINIISSTVYTKDSTIKDKIQLYGISLIFLLLLYNSPSGLVLYWTMNNLFSLVKNIILKTKHPKNIILAILIPLIFALNIYLLFIHPGRLSKRLMTALLVSLPLILIFSRKIIQFLNKYYIFSKLQSIKLLLPTYFFIFSCVILFLLHGGIIPSSLIASSVEEFSFLGSQTSPFPFLINTMQQSAGIFLFWPIAIYMFCSVNKRKLFTLVMIILSMISMCNVFLITENFGFFTPTMTFSFPKSFAFIPGAYILNIFMLCIVIVILLFLIFSSKIKVIAFFQIIFIGSLFGYGIINIKKIHKDFILVTESQNENEYKDEGGRGNYINNIGISNDMSQYTFSKTGKNILLIFIDRAVGGYVPYIFEEKPELHEKINGLRWYPNTISYANSTLIGALPIYGGYEYSPMAINKRDNELLINKQKEAYLLLPIIFSNIGYSTTVTDPPLNSHIMSNLAIFADNPEIDAKRVSGKYTAHWLREHQDITVLDIPELLNNNLIRFSFFKSAPLFLRKYIYDIGNWLRPIDTDNLDQKITKDIVSDYVFLDLLNDMTSFTETGNTYTAIYVNLVHNNAFLQAPDYIPVKQVTNKGASVLSNDPGFNLATATFLLLGKWFNYLKEQNVYDNTRIIFVSDHGKLGKDINFPGNINLPNNRSLQEFNALLIVKDFDSKGRIKKDDTFMTNGDVPLLALEGIIENPVNPFTGNLLQADKDNGVAITTITHIGSEKHRNNTYRIGKNQWLYVKDNIFDPSNWSTTPK
jgi:YidC/Oxa1 family membrane protein insertase